jgi:hypothetical protein
MNRRCPPGWLERCPRYLPPDVWDRAKGSLDQDAPPLSEAKAAALVRLIGPDMALTWTGLAARGVSDPESWGSLLALFLAATPGAAFQPELRDAVKVGADLQAEAARQARELAKTLRQLHTLKADYCLTSHPALSYFPFLVQIVTGRPPPGELFNAPWSNGGIAENLTTTADVLDKLAEAAAAPPLTVQHAHQTHALSRQKAVIAEWVRSLDHLFRFHFSRCIKPSGLELTNADLARLCYACLGEAGETNEDAVEQCLRRTKALPRDMQIRYGLIPPDTLTGN